jgi:hypothetical protein
LQWEVLYLKPDVQQWGVLCRHRPEGVPRGVLLCHISERLLPDLLQWEVLSHNPEVLQ